MLVLIHIRCLYIDNIASLQNGRGIVLGQIDGVNTTGYPAGTEIYVASGGGLTTTKPTSGGGVIGVVAKSNASTGIIIVGANKGNGTWGSMKAGLS